MYMLLSSLSQGLCYALVAMGVYISYKILDFPDLSVDGTFPLGGVVSVMLIKSGVNPVLAILAAFITGGAAGFVTGFLHVKFKISNLLAGILVMTALLSINLNIGRTDGIVKVIISYTNNDQTIFNGGLIVFFENIFKPLIGVSARPLGKVLILAIIVLIVKIAIDMFLKTKSGFMLRATGSNEQLVTSMGKNVGVYKILGLMLANAIVSFAGAVYSQQNGYYDNSSGVGMVVIALASVIIGWSVFKNVKFMAKTTGVIIGALLYSACLSFAINIGIDTTYLKLIMAVLFTVVLILSNNLVKGKTHHLIKRRKV